MATQNSIDSYVQLVDSGQLSDRQFEILQFIRKYPNCTYNEISRVKRLHHNAVTARIKELRDMGYIVCSGTKVDEFTHKSNNTYRIRNDDEPADDTTNNAQPKIPSVIADFLKKAVRRENETDVMCSRINGVEWQAGRSGDNVGLKYGEFVTLRNIMVAREDTAQNRFIVAGNNFTVFFRLN